jgi:catechol 2,3-dioxygenase-like lactoylglutathione lyase family enzyme
MDPNVNSPVRELRLAVTVDDFDAAVAFYRDGLGLPEVQSWDEAGGRGSILDAGRATLELISVDQAESIDRVEVGERVVRAGAARLGGPVVTPWQHRNVRLAGPGLQLTLFTVLG